MPTVAATTAPLLRVLSTAPEILVIAKFVVVACEVVACVAVIAPKVEDAVVRSPALRVWSCEKVFAVVVPNALERVMAPVAAEAWSGKVAARESTPVLEITPVEGT